MSFRRTRKPVKRTRRVDVELAQEIETGEHVRHFESRFSTNKAGIRFRIHLLVASCHWIAFESIERSRAAGLIGFQIISSSISIDCRCSYSSFKTILSSKNSRFFDLIKWGYRWIVFMMPRDSRVSNNIRSIFNGCHSRDAICRIVLPTELFSLSVTLAASVHLFR